MVAAIALRLNDLGYPIAAVYDVRREAARQTAAETGAAPVERLSDVTAATDTIVTVVSDDAAMDRIFAAIGDSLLADCAGRTFVNCATLTPQVHVEVERRAEA